MRTPMQKIGILQWTHPYVDGSRDSCRMCELSQMLIVKRAMCSDAQMHVAVHVRWFAGTRQSIEIVYILESMTAINHNLLFDTMITVDDFNQVHGTGIFESIENTAHSSSQPESAAIYPAPANIII